jgi:hypothetical protein
MPKRTHLHASDLRGMAQLATRATLGITDLVEAMHHTVAAPWSLFSKAPVRRMHGVAGFVYKTIRGSTRAIGGGADVLLTSLQPLFPHRAPSAAHAAIVAAVNGVLGDHLAASHNPLAIPMRLRVGDGFARSGSRLIILVHGLCMNDLQWRRDGFDHGTVLAQHLDATPLYVHYNTGLHISTNGAEFAAMLEDLVANWPEPVKSITIIAHSMGGLVTRSAVHTASKARHTWPSMLKDIVFLGTPHHGAPLERGGHWVDMLLGAVPYSAPFARLGKVRSVGITDLRYGNVLDAHWANVAAKRRAALPLPEGIRCFAIAASMGKKRGDATERLLGDGLVPVASALGEPALAFPKARQWVAQEMNHMDLLYDTSVSERMLQWLAPQSKRAAPNKR